MKSRVVVLLVLLIACMGRVCSAQEVRQHPETVKFDWYSRLVSGTSDTTFVINFWATWCVPCVAELPYFEQLRDAYQYKNVSVNLVSLDFVKNKDRVLLPFLEKKKIKSRVVLLDEPNYNAWIDRVDPSWSGALPATVIINNKQKLYLFLEKEVTFAELDSIVSKTVYP